MIRATHVDGRGRKYLVEVDEGVAEDEYGQYPIVGPPDVVDSLDLPEEFKTRLHNQFFVRGIFTYNDARKQGVLEGALKAALKIDSQMLLAAFHQQDSS